MIRILLSCLLAGSAMGAEWLVVCSGQSNMDGRALTADLTAEQKVMPPNVTVYRWVPGNAAKPVPRKQLVEDADKQFGPEVGMVQALAKQRPQDSFVIAKFAVGGTALWQWVPDYDAPGVEYKKPTDKPNGHLYEFLKTGFQAVAKLHPHARPLAFCWLQGESDSGVRAKPYLDNLRRLVANVRRDTGAPSLPFIAADPAAADPLVDAAYKTFTAEDPTASLIACRALAHKDPLHYNAPSQLSIGSSYAELILKRLPAAAK